MGEKMKALTKISLVVTALLSMGYGANASAASLCYIYLSKPCLPVISNPYYAPGRYFIDTDGIAKLNAARCVQRAQEYKSYCRTPGIEAISVFQVDGLNSIAGHTSSDGKTYISNGLGRWTTYHD